MESLAYLDGVVDHLLARCFAFDVFALVHVFEEFGRRGFGDAVLEVGADVCGAVGAILLAEVVEDECCRLLRVELSLLHFLVVFLRGRHCGVLWWR